MNFQKFVVYNSSTKLLKTIKMLNASMDVHLIVVVLLGFCSLAIAWKLGRSLNRSPNWP